MNELGNSVDSQAVNAPLRTERGAVELGHSYACEFGSGGIALIHLTIIRALRVRKAGLRQVVHVVLNGAWMCPSARRTDQWITAVIIGCVRADFVDPRVQKLTGSITKGDHAFATGLILDRRSLIRPMLNMQILFLATVIFNVSGYQGSATKGPFP